MHMGRLWVNPVTTSAPAFRLELPGGLEQEFHTDDTLHDPIGTYVSKDGWSEFSESISGASYETAVSPGGIKYRFAVANRHNPNAEYLYLSEIVDPIGSRIAVTYANRGDSNAYVDTVTDAFGRVVRFFYQDNTVHLDDPDRLDRVTVLDNNGATATYDFNVLEAGFTFHNVLGSFTPPVGLTTSYDYSIQSGDSTNDVELKRITLPTTGTIQYTYADHNFYYPLRNTGVVVGPAGHAIDLGAKTPGGLTLSLDAATRLAGRLGGELGLAELDAAIVGPGVRIFEDAARPGTLRIFNSAITQFGGEGLVVVINPVTNTVVTVFPSNTAFMANTARFTEILP
jgi:hypothetical protein